MSLAEAILTVALATFIAAVPLAHRRPESGAVAAVLAVAVVVDLLVTVAPALGIEALRMRVTGRNALLGIGAALGLVVWVSAAVAAALWLRGRYVAYLRVLLVTQLTWLACYLSFLYGMHVYPTH